MNILSWNPDESPVSVVDMVLNQHPVDDITVHRAIGRRMMEAGVSQPVDKVVADARRGQDWALDLIRTMELPAPNAKLAMPVQDFGTHRPSRWLDGFFSRFSSAPKRHA
ncbi:hypothetical protein U0C82_17885 [Fulvimarina sp. 2208YS6-2-32]|uniref:Uncharacterized protein n=1 Tax=Fulvimarina uroteuthidis TaxID=3098149 RepID=A0ABU5I6K4_9HYPH|nr:hypothetical protein [Fulvimarina sp. 2208YS6-2-32]MDY8111004.1 hypothetical protein [Fulvimarina sp. 2208YS6-2-32]